MSQFFIVVVLVASRRDRLDIFPRLLRTSSCRILNFNFYTHKTRIVIYIIHSWIVVCLLGGYNSSNLPKRHEAQ